MVSAPALCIDKPEPRVRVPTTWPAITAPKVLIVEDDRDCSQSLAILLQHWGYQALMESNGANALGRIAREEPAVALLDLGLPGMHGLKLLHEIRMQGLAPRVVVVTAAGSPEIEQRALAMGAECLLAKPIDHRELQQVLGDLLPPPALPAALRGRGRGSIEQA